jgi:hypothetical protein
MKSGVKFTNAQWLNPLYNKSIPLETQQSISQ